MAESVYYPQFGDPRLLFQPCPANPLFQPWDKQAFYNQQGTIYKTPRYWISMIDRLLHPWTFCLPGEGWLAVNERAAMISAVFRGKLYI
jgi:hypothetical protein